MSAPWHLRVEHLDEPLGIDVRRPRLSWWLPRATREQVGYRIRAGEWDSGRVASDRSVLVPYDGPQLASGQRVEWQVKVWTEAGESAWSAPGWWEAGLLEPRDWTARWVEPAEPDDPGPPGRRPAHLLRHEFTLEQPAVRARLYATAHGVYEPFLNGERVGEAELTPGFTTYPSTLHVTTFDVTGLVAEGANVLGAVLSDGWYRGLVGYLRAHEVYGERLALLAQLCVDHDDGTSTVIGTGPGSRSATGAIRGADLIAGQVVDLRRDRPGWCSPGGDPGGAWSPVAVFEHDLGRLGSSPAPPVRRVEEVRAVAVTRPRPDRQVVDLGQNLNGWVRVSDLGPEGTTLTLTHGEALDAAGDVTLDHLDVMDVVARTPLPVGQVDVITSAGNPGATFEPRHTTHGFRYVRVEGHPGRLTTDDVTGIVVHTALSRTGWFRCSDERVNRLHEAAVWSFRGNACDIPTDCPQRERAGWTGDWQLFVPTAAFLFDVAGFSVKWLRDLAADQRADGAVRSFAPDPPGGDDHGIKSLLEGSAGWGDAAVIVPWEIWRAYGDEQVLEQQWPSMTAWVEFAARAARDGRHERRVEARPEPAPHETFVWDTGYHWGEWLEPGDELAGSVAANIGKDHGDIATAFLHRSSYLLARIARVLGRDDDAARYDDLAAAARAAWQAEFVGPDGSLSPDTQANHVRALAFALVPDELRAQTARRLVELIRSAGTHLGTGFLATPSLLPVLADTGHLEVAYELLLQDTPPSWLAMIERGATTIWEAWDGVDEHGVPHASLNHYSKGAVISFLHTHTAGIRLLDDPPAYRRFRVEPTPGGGLTWAEAVHDSPYGRIESSWRVEGDRFRSTVGVPSGTTAEILLPDGQRIETGPGTATYSCVS